VDTVPAGCESTLSPARRLDPQVEQPIHQATGLQVKAVLIGLLFLVQGKDEVGHVELVVEPPAGNLRAVRTDRPVLWRGCP